MKVQRRDLLKSALGGLAVVNLLPGRSFGLPRPGPVGPKRAVFIPLRGGVDGLSVVVPHDPLIYGQYHNRRNVLKITSTPNDFADGTGLGFHPNMTRLKALWDAGQVAVFHQVGWPVSSQSHFYSQDRNAAARLDATTHDSGWVARTADHLQFDTTQMAATGIGSVIDVRVPPGSTYTPLSLRDLDAFALPANANDPEDPTSLARNTAGQDAEAAIASANPIVDAFHQANLSAFQLVQEIADGIADYPAAGSYSGSPLGRNLKDLARLISVVQHAPNEEYVAPELCVTFRGGFDTHSGQDVDLPPLLTDVDVNVQAFVDDLVALGEYDDTIVFVFTEFGRRIAENGNRGTDHGDGNNALMIGGSVNGTRPYGNISSATDLANLFNVPVSMDIRHVFETVLRDWYGLQASDVLAILDDPSDPTLRPDLSGLFTC